MITQFENKLVSSFFLYIDHEVLRKGQAYTVQTINFNKSSDYFQIDGVNYYPFTSAFDQLVSDASIPTGGFSQISINSGAGIDLGQSGFFGVNYDRGEIYFTGSNYSGNSVTATGCIKDFNIYLNENSEEELLFETKFSLRPKSSDQSVSSSSQLLNKQITYPCIFIRMESGTGEDFAFGGLDKMISNFRCLVLAENTYSLDAVCSILKDLRKTEFSTIDPAQLPYSSFGAITGSAYNYNNQVANQTDKSLIWDVSVSKVSFSDSKIKLANPQIHSAIVDFEVYSFRNPRT